jgi:hypothetical protein
MILPRLCQVLPSPQRKLDRVLSSLATCRIDLPFNPKMVLPLVLLVLIPLLRRKPEGSVITVATRLLDRVLKTQMLVLPRLCQILPPPQRKLLDGVLSSSATSQIDLPFNPKMVLPLVLLVLIPLLRRKLEGSVITVAIRSLDRVLKIQTVQSVRVCQVILQLKRKPATPLALPATYCLMITQG